MAIQLFKMLLCDLTDHKVSKHVMGGVQKSIVDVCRLSNSIQTSNGSFDAIFAVSHSLWTTTSIKISIDKGFYAYINSDQTQE